MFEKRRLILFDKSLVPRGQKIYTFSVYIIIVKKSSTDFIKIYKNFLFFNFFLRIFYKIYSDLNFQGKSKAKNEVICPAAKPLSAYNRAKRFRRCFPQKMWETTAEPFSYKIFPKEQMSFGNITRKNNFTF